MPSAIARGTLTMTSRLFPPLSHPTRSVELGMNDQGGTPTEKYIANMTAFDEMIRKANARPVYLTASPINSGSTTKNLGGNARLNDYATALKTFAEAKNAPFADQFHQL